MTLYLPYLTCLFNLGFGLINLEKSLPLNGSNELNAFIVNNRPLNDGNSDHIVLETKNCSYSKVSVTLSWYDQPGYVNCAKCLINDLDLSIQMGGELFFPNAGDSSDRLNNVERIHLNVIAGEEIKIVVKAQNLAASPQKYSLIATGCFDVIDEKSTNGILPC